MSSILPKNFQNIYVTNIIPDTATSTSSLSATNITATNLVVTSATIPNITLTGSLNANFNSNTIGNIFTTGGNVGVGTITPSSAFDIITTNTFGNIFFGSTNNNRKIILYNTGTNQHQFYGFGTNASSLRYQVAGTATDHIFYAAASGTSSNELFRIQGTGNIIVAGTTNSVSLSSGNIFSTNLSSANLTSTNLTSTNLVASSATVSNIILTGSLNANFNSNTLGNLFTTGGNVGIGLVTPNAPLQFSNNLLNRKIVLYDSNNNDHRFFGLGINNNILRYQVDTTTCDHVFYAGINSTTSNELFRISGTGNITVPGTTNSVSLSSGNIFSTNVSSTNLIATTSTIPNSVFTNITTNTLLASTSVSSAGLFSTNITSTNILGTNTSLTNLICSTGTFANKVGGSQTIGTILVTTSANLSGNSNTIGNIFTTGGNVGVGTVTPAFTLDIAGSLRVSSLFVNSSSIIATGGTTTLSTAANTNQFVVGTAGHTVLLPNSTGLAIGAEYYIVNQSTQAVTVGNNTATTINILYPGVSQFYTLTSNTAAGGTWGILGSNFFNASTGNMGFNNTNPGTSLDIIGSSRVLGMNYIGNPNNTADNLGTFIDGNNNGLGYRLGIIKKNGGGPFFAVNNISNFIFAAANNTDASQITTNSYTTVMTLSTQGHLVITGGFTSGSHLISSGNLTISSGSLITNLLSSNTLGNIYTTGGNIGINTTAPSSISFLTINAGNNGIVTQASIAFSYAGIASGYNHFITSRHLNVSNSNQNSLDLWINNSNTITGSSSPNFGNVNSMSVTAVGVGIFNSNPNYTLDVSGTTRITNTTATSMGTLIVVGPGNTGYIPATATSGQLASFYGPGGTGINTNIDLSTYMPTGFANNLPSVRFNMLDLGSGNSSFNILTRNSGGSGTMGSRIYIDGSGNVGIANTSPTYTLDISGTLHVSGGSKIVISGGVDGTSARGIYMYTDNDSNWGIYMASSGAGKSLANASAVAGAGFSSNAIRYRVPNTSSQGFIFENTSEQLLSSIRGSDGLTYFAGNVGIGTTSPNATLHVATNGTQGLYAGPYTFTSAAGGTLPTLLYKTQAVFNSNVNGWPATSGTVGNAIALRVRGNDNAVIDFGVNTGNGGWIQNTDYSSGYNLNYPLSLNPNGGNVNINTTGGQGYGLDVNGTTRITGSGTGTNGSLFLTGNDIYGHTLHISTIANTQKRMSLSNSGTVSNIISYDFGSNTPMPLVFQYAGGTTQIGSTALFTTNGNLTVTGDVLAYGSISDQRLKTNIETITSEFAIDTVKKLNPVTFNWKENVFNTEKQNKFDSGFIAQEVEAILKHATGEYTHFETGTVYKNLKHERIVPYLLRTVQSLLERVELLETFKKS
jgi:hypothetical protein